MHIIANPGLERTEIKLGGRYKTVTTVNIMTERFIVVDRLASRREVALKSCETGVVS